MRYFCVIFSITEDVTVKVTEIKCSCGTGEYVRKIERVSGSRRKDKYVCKLKDDFSMYLVKLVKSIYALILLHKSLDGSSI